MVSSSRRASRSLTSSMAPTPGYPALLTTAHGCTSSITAAHRRVEQGLVAVGARLANTLPLVGLTPVGCCGGLAVEAGESDERDLTSISLPCQLSDVELTSGAHGSGSGIPNVRVVLPDNAGDRLGRFLQRGDVSGGSIQVHSERIRSPRRRGQGQKPLWRCKSL